jgi:hypothetical protein
MALEFGLFLRCKRFGAPNQSKKRTLILDTDQYRYRNFISDVAGHDIRAHGAERFTRRDKNYSPLRHVPERAAGGVCNP